MKSAETQSIRKVHVIFKTHLDIGFTDYAREVLKKYITEYIPTAIHTAKILRERGERFIWTTGSWLIYEYLEQAPTGDKALLEQAIAQGDIVWHGLPFTTHSELMDASLFRFGLGLSQDLDNRFGKKTIAAKMTDVPGHTRAIVPLLGEAGIQFLHIGVNPASTPPDVPPVFVWQAPGGADVMVMYHKGSYGEMMIVPGLDEAISFAHTDDNRGPQSPEAAIASLDHLRKEFPGSEVVASTMDAFAQSLLRVKSQLPVVTDEIGDTWIHGVGSDPTKVSQFRELSRMRREWLRNNKPITAEPSFDRFSRALMMVPEHTWGMDIKMYLDDYEHYTRDQFSAARKQPNFQKYEASWQEQRDYLKSAIVALRNSSEGEEARHRLTGITPKKPNISHFQKVSDLSTVFETPHFMLGFDSETGGINRLVHKAADHAWAEPGHLLGQFTYQSFSEQDYEHFYHTYIINKRETAHWSRPDYTKPGMENAKVESRTWLPQVTGVYRFSEEADERFVVEMEAPEEIRATYGCPRQFVMQVTLPDKLPIVNIDFQWFDKPASRLPEAMWLSFAPRIKNVQGWTLDKMSYPISPLEVIKNGNRKLHAIDRGVSYRGDDGSLSIESLDAPLVAPGEPSLLDFNNKQPAIKKGMHFNLYNNIWGTNFRMWYEDDARFRFTLRFE